MSTSRRTTQTHRQPQETSQGRERSWSKTGIYRTRYTRVRALHISLYFVLVEQYRYHLMYRYSNSRARSYHTTRAAVPGFGHISAHPAVRWFQEIVQSVLISELQREHRSNVRKGRQKGGKERRHRVLEQVQHRSLQISLHVCSAAHFVANAAHLADPKEQTEREYNSVPKYRDHFYMNNTYKRTYIYGQSGKKLCWKSRGGGDNTTYQVPGYILLLCWTTTITWQAFTASNRDVLCGGGGWIANAGFRTVGAVSISAWARSRRSRSGPCDVASYLSTLNIPSVHILHCSTGTPLISVWYWPTAHYPFTAADTAAMPYGKSNPKRGQESLGKALQRRRALERAAADRYYFPPPKG